MEIDKVREQLIAATKQFTDEPVDEAVETIIDLLEQQIPPAEALANEFLDHGAFKEAYECIEGVIYKFCTAHNSTEKEQKILVEAAKMGLQDLFPKTAFIKIPTVLTAIYIAQDDDDRYCYDNYYHTFVENEDYEYSFFNYIEIQPKLKPWWEVSFVLSVSEEFQDMIKNDSCISYISTIVDHHWLEDVYKCYGKEKLYALNFFCETYKISDLHTNNIGYITKEGKDYPIIFDWLSK